MKKVLALTLVLALMLAFTACGTEDAEWKQFIKEYDEWVDDYIELANKMKANPTDTSLIQEYSKMAAEVASWSTKADKISAELEDPKVAAEFAAELAKISEKLAKIAG